MTHTAFRRTIAVIGIGLGVGLAGALPATARQDPGLKPTVTLPYSQDVYENHYGTHVPPERQGSVTTPQVFAVDDNAIEYLQLGGGVLAGIALAGAGMAVASRRTHSHLAHPA